MDQHRWKWDSRLHLWYCKRCGTTIRSSSKCVKRISNKAKKAMREKGQLDLFMPLLIEAIFGKTKK